ncbi:hypothetical protein P7M37_25080, partial [Vibrio parahaemolyticus]|nr:hypothetical protein [Vibrio parahaemolyticus]
AYSRFALFPQTPVIAVVGNDACWSQISREQVPILGSNVACGLAFTGKFSVLDVGICAPFIQNPKPVKLARCVNRK